MEPSTKDAATKAAWITGGLALAGTVITVLFTSGVLGPGEPPPPAPATFAAVPTTPSPEPTTAEPTTPTPEPTPVVPAGVEGHWMGGGSVSANFHLTIASDGTWTLIDGNNVQAGHVDEGKVVFNGSQAVFYYNDGSTPLVVDWTMAETPTNTVLHLGTYTYTRQ